MNFGEVFSRAWQIIWKNKVLWIFGIMAGLAASGDSGSGLRFDYQADGSFPWLDRLTANIPAWAVLLLILFGIALFFVIILLSTLGRAGLMRGAWLADSGEGQLTFSRLFAESRAYFLRVLLLQILLFGVGLTLILILAVPSILSLGLALLCLWPLFCLLVPFFFALSVLSKLAIAGITGENLGVIESLRRAWDLARPNIIQVIAVALALGIGSFVVGAIIGIPMLAIAAPLLLGIARGSAGISGSWVVISALLFILYLPVLLAVNGVMTAYIDSVWTLVFRRLSGLGVQGGAQIY